MSGSVSSFQLSALLGVTLLVGCAVSDNNLFATSDAAVQDSSAGGAGGGSSGSGSTAGVGGVGGGVGGGGGVDGGGSGGVGGTGAGGIATGGAGGGGTGGTGGTGGLGGGGLGGSGTGGTGGGTSTGDCCTAQTTPGCANATIKSCVCAKDAFCCSSVWDIGCVSEVKTLSCGNCGTGGSGGSGGFGGSGGLGGSGGTSGDCCVVHSTPTCTVPSVSACVCAVDSYCCSVDWDSICVGEVTSMGCGTC